AQLRVSALEEETERLHARHVLRLAAAGGRQYARARVHVRNDQRRNPATLRLGLSPLGLRSAQPNLGSAVPLGEGQAQHPRRQRGPLVQAAAAQRAAKGEPRAVRRCRGVTRGGMCSLLGAVRLPFWGEGWGEGVTGQTERPYPLTPPLSLWEREKTEIAASSTLSIGVAAVAYHCVAVRGGRFSRPCTRPTRGR